NELVRGQQEFRQIPSLDPLDVDRCYSPRLGGFAEIRQYLDAWMCLEGICPAQGQIAQPGGRATPTASLMESQGLPKRRPDAPRVRPDGFELPDVAVLLFGGCLQRPESRDHLLSNVERAVADRRQEPFVQA